MIRAKHRRRSSRWRGEYLRSVGATAATSVAVSGVAAVGGLLLARYLGPSGRGTFAVVTSYMLAAATIGECGLTTAICYLVARDRSSARDSIRTGGAMLVMLGILVGAAGIAAAPLVLDDPEAVTAFRVAFAAQPLVFGASTWLFALQATRIGSWNVVRALQPAVYTTAVVTLAVTNLLTVERAVFCLVGSTALQAIAAVVLCRLALPGRGRLRRSTGRKLAGYGGATMLSAVPYLLNAHLDVLLLALLVEPAEVGHYAVAVSLSMLSQPVCSAFGNVAMPRLAAAAAVAGTDGTTAGSARRVALTAVGASLATGVLCMGAVSAIAPLAVHGLLGPDYAPSVGLFWLLAPGAAVLGCNRAIDDVLRGLGRALTVARCEWIGTVVTVALLATLVPLMGVAGAAVASSIAYGVAFAFLLHAVLRAVGITARSVPARLRRAAGRGRRDWLGVPSESGRGNAA
ncbi:MULTISPECIES: oligosaccharide flippase family protein [unclassified Pseudofrankia]|uniref:oligosaccharide flippase family protein n=1 Tax=unclassified Pseudofrankia TaxID=2994372 RepID=UPI0008DB2D33|nr:MULTISPECIES: oligosaccharide flippase family protein [unclassified Pseudofrankia]MDT3443982.1 oligosaccharide flippase family protein [Pseudofrankia sp. BMG5.37]OHV44386.1 polysaccharide biosynthesis protein [Pseudofrankia sp. BMG5.36]